MRGDADDGEDGLDGAGRRDVSVREPDAAAACCAAPEPRATAPDRRHAVARAVRLEILTVAWNVVEGIVAVAAGLAASSVVLVGFGLDSFVETASALVLLWRLRADAASPDAEASERLDARARRAVAVSLVLLALWVSFDALRGLVRREEPSASLVGVALTLVSIGVMVWLARAKRRLAAELGSRALAADAFQTTACWWLSIVTLAGLGANAALGWWWADGVAALALAGLVAREAALHWRGDACCA